MKLKLYRPKSFRNKVLYAASFFFSVKKIHKILDKCFKMFDKSGCKYIANLASYYSWPSQTVERSVYGEAVFVNFENYKLPVPAKYDFLLRRIYGDYMELPPEEKRGIRHHFVAVGTNAQSELSDED